MRERTSIESRMYRIHFMHVTMSMLDTSVHRMYAYLPVGHVRYVRFRTVIGKLLESSVPNAFSCNVNSTSNALSTCILIFMANGRTIFVFPFFGSSFGKRNLYIFHVIGWNELCVIRFTSTQVTNCNDLEKNTKFISFICWIFVWFHVPKSSLKQLHTTIVFVQLASMMIETCFWIYQLVGS